VSNLTVFENGQFVTRENHPQVLVPLARYRVRYLGDGFHSQHVGETATVVARMSIQSWVIRLEFDNGDLWWVADYDTEGVRASE
jgi:hypothetical protein